ncbi:hypothetical protein E1091_04195 [Micromonospora fluostatini]|uniref:Holin n=1 Tax=Micromonospora fluostatini TaxID=1629071 RepID=A0ABY2DKH8_9ACTN|nr:hypothetical protein E1091_04195 [Micromonospora fluostatini]
MIKKFLVAVAGAVAVAVAGALTDNQVTTVEAVQVVIAVATAAQVWVTTNVPTLTWAKTVTAVLLGVTNVLVGVIADGISAADVAVLIVAAFTAAGVYAVPNGSTHRPAPPAQPAI